MTAASRSAGGGDPGGILLGVGAYVLWGVLPFYFHLLSRVPAVQVLAHRVLWSLILLAALVTALGRWRSLRAAVTRRTLTLLAGSASLIALNWLIYIWSVQHGHVLAASLGYFINPLVNVALGVLVLRERLSRLQRTAIAVAAAGVLVLGLGGGGGSLLISLSLATTFGLYGLLRKVVAVDALNGLTIETLMLAPASAAILAVASAMGEGAFGRSGSTDLLLALAGVITAVPLLMFAAAAKRMPYATLGQLQYIGPSLQFAEAVLFGEQVRPVHMITFALIWGGCALFAWDSLRASLPEPAAEHH